MFSALDGSSHTWFLKGMQLKKTKDVVHDFRETPVPATDAQSLTPDSRLDWGCELCFHRFL
jgi:hypothetical protein